MVEIVHLVITVGAAMALVTYMAPIAIGFLFG